MVIGTYSKVFNGRTKTIQLLNVLIMGIWFMNLILVYLDTHDLSDPVLQSHKILLVLNVIGIVFGLIGYKVKGHQSYGFKSASLLIGGVFHIITASTYVLNYPPLRVGLLQECLFAVIFFLSGVYSLTSEEKYCERINSD